MATFLREQSRWLYIVEFRCYAIGYYKKDSWHCHIPMCYASPEIIGKFKEISEIDAETMFIMIAIQSDELDYRKVVIGKPVICEIQESQGWQLLADDSVEEAKSGKLIINGQIVYGLTPFGMLWTPVRPDMGAVDMYERDWGKIHNAIGKNLGIEEMPR
jgi:hypothetical protein